MFRLKGSTDECKPRRLFKARRLAGNTLYVGPEWTGPQPRYLAKVEVLLRAAAGQARPGQVGNIEVRHGDDCAFFDGGCCDCDPDVRLVPAVAS